MKTNFKMNVKGVEVVVEFEGSVREFGGLNKEIINSIKDCASLFNIENQDKIYDAMSYAINRAATIQKRIMVVNKELEDFEKAINKK